MSTTAHDEFRKRSRGADVSGLTFENFLFNDGVIE